MHKSRLAGFIIDCRTDDLHGAARFWSEALGMATEVLPGQEGDKYVKLRVPDERLHVEAVGIDDATRKGGPRQRDSSPRSQPVPAAKRLRRRQSGRGS